jgi:[ribosomal protein S18]-alanine N-acetyltransferase
MSDIKFYKAKLDDLNAIVIIEKNIHLHPWSKQQFIDALNAGDFIFSLKSQSNLIAYAVLKPILDEIELLNIAVAKEYQGRGYGNVLLEKLIQKLSKQDYKKILLEVRESNARAISLYMNCHFKETGKRKGYYPCDDGKEDAILFELMLE